MIEWHKARDVLPPYDIPILVIKKLNGRYIPETVTRTRCIMAYGDNVWWSGIDWQYVKGDDCWAYINLPEPEKDGD